MQKCKQEVEGIMRVFQGKAKPCPEASTPWLHKLLEELRKAYYVLPTWHEGDGGLAEEMDQLAQQYLLAAFYCCMPEAEAAAAAQYRAAQPYTLADLQAICLHVQQFLKKGPPPHTPCYITEGILGRLAKGEPVVPSSPEEGYMED